LRIAAGAEMPKAAAEARNDYPLGQYRLFIDAVLAGEPPPAAVDPKLVDMLLPYAEPLRATLARLAEGSNP
jgi:hypothetical protein